VKLSTSAVTPLLPFWPPTAAQPKAPVSPPSAFTPPAPIIIGYSIEAENSPSTYVIPPAWPPPPPLQ